MNLITRYFDAQLVGRLGQKVLPNIVPLLTKSQVRKCGCCGQTSLFLQFGTKPVFQSCVLCSASFRFELLGRFIRKTYDLSGKTVLELDPQSPLRKLLSHAGTHIRSYYQPGVETGMVRSDGAVMQDITNLGYSDNSLDMIVSSEVLEHVPDAMAAFKEARRTLRPGGVHVFTIPLQPATQRLADVRAGIVHQLVFPPEYHSDPLNPKGILAFWHYGPDMQEWFGESGLVFQRHAVDDGLGGHAFVWTAEKPVTANIQ